MIGYGRMGKAIEAFAHQAGHNIIGIRQNNRISFTEFLKKLPSPPDVAIEFTQPEAAFQNVSNCLLAGIPIVCGTTGWNHQVPEAEELCRKTHGALIISSNFSIGVNIFFELNRQFGHVLSRFQEFKIIITETHHTEKKDMPSGTAVRLAEDLMGVRKDFTGWQLNSLKDSEEIPIFSSRIPGEVGSHTIYWASPIEQISIRHKALSREGFAKGAILAAEFIFDKKGVFSMREVLKF